MFQQIFGTDPVPHPPAGAAAETYVPGGAATLMKVPDFIRGVMAKTPATVPQNPAGYAGAGVRAAYEIIKALW